MGDRLTMSAHFIPLADIDSLAKLTQLCIKEIVKLPRVLKYIVSDRDPRFIFHF